MNVASQAVTRNYVSMLAAGGRWVHRGKRNCRRRVVCITAIEGMTVVLRDAGSRSSKGLRRMDAAIFLRSYKPAATPEEEKD